MSKTIRASARMILAVVALVCVWLASQSAAFPVSLESTTQLLEELKKPDLEPNHVSFLLSTTKEENRDDVIIDTYSVAQLIGLNSQLIYRNCDISGLERRLDICLGLDKANDSVELKNNLYNFCKDRLASLVNFCRTSAMGSSMNELINKIRLELR